MSQCTCAEAIAASERRKQTLPDGTRLVPRVCSHRAVSVDGPFSQPIFEEKTD